MPVKHKIDSRQKGARAERELVSLLSQWLGCQVSRSPHSGAYATTTDTDSMAGDLIVDHPQWPYCIEIKYREGWTLDHLLSDSGPIWQWWQQAIDQCPPDRQPLLLFRRSRQPWIGMVRADTTPVIPDGSLYLLARGLLVFRLKSLLEIDHREVLDADRQT